MSPTRERHIPEESTMTDRIAGLLADRASRSHRRVLGSIEEVEEDQANQWVTPTAPSLKFHVWHAARWADRLAVHLAALVGPVAGVADREVWEVDALARRWGFPVDRLGRGATGLGMDDADAQGLPMPSIPEIADYAGRAFALATEQIAAVPDDRLLDRALGLYGREDTILGMILAHLSHTDRHLGMTEAIWGVLGRPGSVSG
jgi:hypothetical protein